MVTDSNDGSCKLCLKELMSFPWTNVGLPVQSSLGSLPGFQVTRGVLPGAVPSAHPPLRECTHRTDVTRPGANEPLRLLPSSSPNSLMFPLSRRRYHPPPSHQHRDGQIQSVTKSSGSLLSNTTHIPGVCRYMFNNQIFGEKILNLQCCQFPWCTSSSMADLKLLT